MKSFLLLLLLVVNVGFASDESEKLALELDIRSTIYQSNLQGQIYVAKEVKKIVENAIESSSYSEDEDIDKLLKEVIDGECCLKEKGVGPLLKNAVKDVIKEVRGVARKEGVAIAVLLGVGEVLELLSPVIFTAIGQPQLIIVGELVLAPEINVPAVLAVKKLIKRRKLIKLYGGKDNFLKIKRLRKSLDKDYGLSEDTVAFFENGHYFSVTKNFGILKRIASGIGLSKKINPITLKKALKKNGYWNSDLNKIKKSDLESSLKTILMVSYVLENEPEGHDFLLSKFPDLHFEEKPIQSGSEVQKWAMEFEQVKTIDDLAQWSSKVPKTSKSLEVILLWKQVFYPRIMEESVGMGFKMYRKWAKTLDGFVAKAELNPYELWDNNWQAAFNSYLAVE